MRKLILGVLFSILLVSTFAAFLTQCPTLLPTTISKGAETDSADSISFHIESGDAFPSDIDLNVSVRCNFNLKVNFSESWVPPNETSQHHLDLNPEFSDLTTSIDVDLGWMTMTGAEQTVSINPSYLLGDSPTVQVSYGSINVFVDIHGMLDTQIIMLNGTIDPSNITWLTWDKRDLTVTNDLQPGQSLSMEMSLNYTTDYDIRVEGIGTHYGATPVAWNEQQYQQSIGVVPEFPSVLLLPIFVLVTLLAAAAHRGKFALSKGMNKEKWPSDC